jgi:tripartite-type tricarboxylate transporter receptor subunit TctC
MLMLARVTGLVACCLSALAVPAYAQSYPARPIRVIISVSAGGTGDIITHAVGEQMHKRLGQPLVIEPRPGGNQIIAGRACAEAAPDGYTICVLSGETLASNEFMFKKVPYDPDKDFAPITQLFINPQALVVNASLGVKTLDELIAYAKSHPGTLSYLAPSLSHYLFFEYLNRRHGTDFVRIPFRGGGEAVASMLSGAVPVSFFGLANFRSFLEAGSMNGLGIDGIERSKLFPHLPTMAEAGYKEPILRQYFAMVAPAKTPAAVIDLLQKEIAAIVSEPAFRQKQFAERSLDPVANTPAEFARYLKDERVVARRIVQEAGIEPQ